jgi:uncharacterized protein (DUF58 family)
MPSDREFLDPRVIAKISDLELVAKCIVEGFVLGLHRSPYQGFSVEFSSYRKYSEGDSLRFVDWKVFAKTDRFYVKQFEETTNLMGYVLLDTSASMSLGDPHITKFRYGASLAAALAYLMLRQGDAAGLVAFDSGGVDYTPPRRQSIQLGRILARLSQLRPSQRTEFRSGLRDVAERIYRRGLIVLISDLMAEPDEILDVLRYFRYKKHEVIVFQVLSQMELDFPFRDQHEFIDVETNERLVTQSSYIREAYLEALAEHNRRLRESCLAMDVDFVGLSLSDWLGDALMSYLTKRSACG